LQDAHFALPEPTCHFMPSCSNKNNLLSAIAALLLMFSLFSCFKKKKTPPETIETWLEAHFPGQLKVLYGNINLNVMDMYRGHKTAVLADQSDTVVQFVAYWEKGDGGTGLHEEAIREAWQRARTDVEQSRQLFAALKTAGLQRLSAAVIDESAFIQVFAEPDAAARENIPAQVLTALKAHPELKQTHYWVEIMEPQAYGQKCGDIIPMEYWKTEKSWHDRELLLELDFEWPSDLTAARLRNAWKINTAAARCDAFMDDAYKHALAWANKNLDTPFYLEPDQMIAVETDDRDGLAIHYSFPYFDKKPEEDSQDLVEPKGYVSGLYQTERKIFTQIKKTDPSEL
jgi:hypothetical protein